MESTEFSAAETEQIQNELVLRPVGIVRNSIKAPSLQAGDDGLKAREESERFKKSISETRNAVSQIIIKESIEQILDGIEEYSHIKVLYWAHRVTESGRQLTRVLPMGSMENPLTGIFSTFSPARPNPILVTVAKLHKREGNILHVSGLDAIDGSPVIDIKPYVREFYPQEETRIPDWIQRFLERREPDTD